MKQLSLEEIKKIRNIPMNFLVGKERSGTTLLQIILNGHPNVVAPPESRFIMLLYSRYGGVTNWTEKLLTNFCNDIFKEKAFKNFWDIDKKALLASFITAKEIATYPLLCKITFYHFAPEKEMKLFFDKNPIYCYYIPQLTKLFPEAKFIQLVRDYRANIVSHSRVFVSKQGADISYRWLKMNMHVEKAKSFSPKRYFTIKYENLVSETILSLREICGFLSIPIYEKMALEHTNNVYSSYSRNTKIRFRNIHQKVFNPISPVFIDEWKLKLTQEDISQAERVAGGYGEKMYGYIRVSSSESHGKKLSVKFTIKLKYHFIKKFYMVMLNNPSLYFIITKHVWKSF